jgi:3-phenylpropionate/trans-cinnamate dioxygenase ferredoxin subunit
MALIDVGASEDFVEGEKKVVDVNGERVLLVRYGEKVYGMQSKCTHQGADLGMAGKVTGNVLHCRMHGASFMITSGEVLSHAGAKDLKMYKVEEKDGRVLVEA